MAGKRLNFPYVIRLWQEVTSPHWYSVLLEDLVKSRSREIRIQAFPIALKFDRHIGSSVAEVPVKLQNMIINTFNLVASRLREILTAQWIDAMGRRCIS